MEKMMTPEEMQEYRKTERLLKVDVNYKDKNPEQFDIAAYYKANWTNKGKEIMRQHGLSNFSHIKLGDSRLWYEQSFSQDCYNPKLKHEAENVGLSEEHIRANRHRDYAFASARCSAEEIEAIEASMRDKLQQKRQTGPYQLRKTFKYFDQSNTGGLSFPEVRRVLELMGFSFSETQVLAMFAMHDKDMTGRIRYRDFIQRLMEKDFVEVKASWLQSKSQLADLDSKRRSVKEAAAKAKGDTPPDYPAEEYAESVRMERAHTKELWDMLDRDGTGLSDEQLRVMLLLVGGKGVTRDRLDALFSDAISGIFSSSQPINTAFTANQIAGRNNSSTSISVINNSGDVAAAVEKKMTGKGAGGKAVGAVTHTTHACAHMHASQSERRVSFDAFWEWWSQRK